MDNEGLAKHKNIYIEAIIIIFFLLGIPYFVKTAFMFFMEMYINKSIALLQAECFAYIITCAYDIIILWCGFLSNSFNIVINRLRSFFSTLFYIKLKDSIKFSFINIKNEGAFFWLYLSIIFYHFVSMINSLKVFIH